MRWIVIADISWALRLSIWGALVRKKGYLWMREDIPWNEGNWCTMATCKGGKFFLSVRQPRSLNFSSSCPDTLSSWLRVDWLSCKTLQAIKRVLNWGRRQHCRLLMNSAVCVVLLPNCRMRTCRKELFGSYCWSWEARIH